MGSDSTLRAVREHAHEAREYKKHLKQLTSAVFVYLAQMDRVMTAPDSHARGQEIARLTNALELENDMARHFGLGISLKAGKLAISRRGEA